MTSVWMVGLILALVEQSRPDRAQAETVLAPIMKAPPVSGLLIFEVIPGSQAAKAGFAVGDILTHYDGQPVSSIDKLQRLARSAIVAIEQKKREPNILIMGRRGDKDFEIELQPATMGLRFVAIEKGLGRTLWRPETAYEPNFAAIERALAQQHRWELITISDQPVGWAHFFHHRRGDELVLRIQSRIKQESVDYKGDVTVTYRADRHLSLTSLRVQSGEQLVLELQREGSRLTGKRVGVPIETDLPADAVTSYLAPLVVGTMPRAPGACVRCSALEAFATTAGPFSDIVCLGPEKMPVNGQVLDAHRYEHTVFGQRSATFWVDANGDLLAQKFENGMLARNSTWKEIAKHFPQVDQEFRAIEQLPDAVKAN